MTLGYPIQVLWILDQNVKGQGHRVTKYKKNILRRRSSMTSVSLHLYRVPVLLFRYAVIILILDFFSYY